MTVARRLRLSSLLPALILACGTLIVHAQSPAPAAPKAISLEDYAKFKRITAAAISGDGKWMHYTVTPNDGDATLFVKSLDDDKAYEVPRGANPAFSDDGRWVAYFIAPPAAEGRGRGRGRGNEGQAQSGSAATPPPARPFEVIDLQTGVKSTFPSVGTFAFSPDGEWLLMRPPSAAAAGANAPAGRGGRGGAAADSAADSNAPAVDLLMRRMATGEQRYLGKVGTYVFDEAGKQMAYTIRGQQRLGNGVYVMALATGEQRTLDAATADYDQLTWSAEGTNLAVLRGEKPAGKALRENVLLTWRGVGTPQMQAASYEPAKASAFPAGMVVSEFAAPRWSNDGARITVGLKEQAPEKPEAADPEANVDVWHWKDDDPQSVQTVQLAAARRATKFAVLDIASGTLRQIADDKMRGVLPTEDLKWAIGMDASPYDGEVEWGASRSDYYRVNLATGERTLIEKGLSRRVGTSPDGKWFVYLKDGRVHSYEMASGTKRVIDGGRSFVNAEDDHDYEKPVYGLGGFSNDGRALLYDRFDVWALPLAGGAVTNLTRGEGAKNAVRYRVVNLARIAAARARPGAGASPDAIDTSKPLLLSAFGEWTKQSGYAELAPTGNITPLIFADKAIGTPMPAKMR